MGIEGIKVSAVSGTLFLLDVGTTERGKECLVQTSEQSGNCLPLLGVNVLSL